MFVCIMLSMFITKVSAAEMVEKTSSIIGEATLVYEYTNDEFARAVGLVPEKFKKHAPDNRLYDVTFEIDFWGAPRTEKQVLETVIETLDLNAFALLKLKIEPQTAPDDELVIRVSYDPTENTAEKMQERRQEWRESLQPLAPKI